MTLSNPICQAFKVITFILWREIENGGVGLLFYRNDNSKPGVR